MINTTDSAPPIAESTPLAPWRAPLARALHRNRALPHSRYLQLATVRADGTPANRTVVFRGFLEGTNQLMFISDRRSEKTNQIQQNPKAEACWYFTKTREQFRFSGCITLITASSDQSHQLESRARTHLWQKISASARLQFAWPPSKAPRESDASFAPPAPNSQLPPDTFCLLLFVVHSVDHLELRGDPQNRYLYTQATAAHDANNSVEAWLTTSVNP